MMIRAFVDSVFSITHDNKSFDTFTWHLNTFIILFRCVRACGFKASFFLF